MPASIGVNLRVTGHCRQGGRKYMEDFFSVAYQQTEDEKDLEYAFFGIYDGHGGAEAAAFAKEHLMETIIKHKNFWSDDDEDVLRAIKDGYIATHYAMWREQDKWPRTASGLPSTAGTTASVAFIRRGKIYIGHVGDSGIILGYQEPGTSEWKARPLTRDHKPENAEEMSRIKRCGGKVISKSGVPRVVWNRPKIGHQGPVRRSTPIDEIPFLAVARSLGDLWSYNSQINQFIVSPNPDCSVLTIDTNLHRCLIFGTDGLYNMLSPTMAVHIVQQAERHNENVALSDSTYRSWMNPSKLLVEKALERWHATKMRADNTSVVTLMLDPPGPPRAQVLKDRKKNLPENGLKIMTRYEEQSSVDDNKKDDGTTADVLVAADPVPCIPNNEILQESVNVEPQSSVTSSDLMNYPLKERNFVPKLRESTSFDPREPSPKNFTDKENLQTKNEDNTIQCNEVSSSNIELDVACSEDETNETNNNNNNAYEKPNLRSSKKENNKIEISQKCGVKRKREEDGGQQLRKSVRIDQNQRKVAEKAKEGKSKKEKKGIKGMFKNSKSIKKKVMSKLQRHKKSNGKNISKCGKIEDISRKSDRILKKNEVQGKQTTKMKVKNALNKKLQHRVLRKKQSS